MELRPILRSLPFLLLPFAFSPPLSRAQGSRPPGGIKTEKGSVLLYFPELISAPRVDRVWFSPDEKHVLLERWNGKAFAGTVKDLNALRSLPDTLTTSLIHWDSRTRRAREVWSGPSDLTRIDRVDWLPSSDVALVKVHHYEPVKTPASPDTLEEARTVQSQLLLKVSPEAETAQVVARAETGGYSDLEVGISPMLPLAVVIMDGKLPTDSEFPMASSGEDARPAIRVQKLFRLIDRTGRIGGGRPLPENFMLHHVHWSPAGDPLVSGMEDLPDKDPAAAWYAMDTRTGDLSRLNGKPALYEEKLPAPKPGDPSQLRVKPSTVRVADGQTALDVGILWLEQEGGSGPGSKALVCTDCSEGRLLPGGDLIVYQSQESVWVVPLMKMSPAATNEAKRQAYQRMALNNARQVAIALKSYASDHEGELPPPGEILKALYTPTNRDPSDFHKDFVYTFPGGMIPEDQKREAVQIGYYQSPYGRALIFADGHVEWRDK
jgi:hypothetical protein